MRGGRLGGGGDLFENVVFLRVRGIKRGGRGSLGLGYELRVERRNDWVRSNCFGDAVVRGEYCLE